jgi:5-methylcytosine-specific restriction endonuclease McrA
MGRLVRRLDYGSCVNRNKLIVLEHPRAPDAEPPFCRWCGEKIRFTAAASGYRKTRNYHRGDRWEDGRRNCRREHRQSFCWSSRDALRWEASLRNEDGRYVLACVDCGQVVEEGRCNRRRARLVYHQETPVDGDGRFSPYPEWQADHQIPVIDGGPHVLENLKVRCVPCHKDKTKREAQMRRRGWKT